MILFTHKDGYQIGLNPDYIIDCKELNERDAFVTVEYPDGVREIPIHMGMQEVVERINDARKTD